MATALQKIKVCFNPITNELMTHHSPKFDTSEMFDPKTRNLVKIPVKMVDNHVFKSDLRVHDYSCGNHTIFVLLLDAASGVQYMIKVDDFLDAIKRRNIINGVISGEWCFRRAGGVCSVIPFDP